MRIKDGMTLEIESPSRDGSYLIIEDVEFHNMEIQLAECVPSKAVLVQGHFEVPPPPKHTITLTMKSANVMQVDER